MFIFKRQINIVSVQCPFVLYCPGIEKRLLKKHDLSFPLVATAIIVNTV